MQSRSRQGAFDAPLLEALEQRIDVYSNLTRPLARGLFPTSELNPVASLNRLRQRSAPVKPTLQCSRCHAKLAFPLARGVRGIAEAYQAICSTVVGLLNKRGPTAIMLGVRAIYVDSVQRVALWARSRVAQKGLEVCDPLIGHRNSTATVVRVCLRLGVVATSFGPTPRSVFARVALAVLRRTLPTPLVMEAPATANGSGPDLVASRNVLVSAVAAEQPDRPFLEAWFSWGATNGHEATESLSRNVNRHRFHCGDYNTLESVEVCS